ncbi:hypothetical protein [Synechocystis sp. PCC 6714]
MKRTVKEAGYKVSFLPTYSPDVNDIEHDFSALRNNKNICL